MATGDLVGYIQEVLPPVTLFPQFAIRVGGSTPAEQVPYWGFDAAAIEYLDFYLELRGYAGGGLTVFLKWMGASATSGVTRWSGAFRRVADDAEDIDTSHTYDYNDVDATTASATGEYDYNSLTFTDGADIDSLANTEAAIFRLRRNASHANDTMAGDAQLVSVAIVET